MNKNSESDRLEQQTVATLTERDMEILRFVSSGQERTREEIQRVCFSDDSGARAVRRRLNTLVHNGYLERTVEAPAASHAKDISITDKGRSALRNGLGKPLDLQVLRILCERGPTTKNQIRKAFFPNNTQHAAFFLEKLERQGYILRTTHSQNMPQQGGDYSRAYHLTEKSLQLLQQHR